MRDLQSKPVIRLIRMSLLLMLLTFSMVAGAQQLDKKISIDIPEQPLEATVKMLESKAGIAFAYESSQMQGKHVKAHQYNNQSLAVILKDILADTDLQFAERNNIVIIKKSASAKQTATLSGYIEDGKTGERLIGVSVYIKGLEEGTITNNFGFYSITQPTGPVALKISYLGYDNIDTTVDFSKDTKLIFKMGLAEHTIKDVVVTAKKQPDLQHNSQMSSIDLSMQTIKSLPAFMGETDVIKALQLLPGVQAGSEGSTGIFVRGGSPDQNLILLDGVPVYNVNHLFGFFSVFNSDAIKSISMIKGGFPARYGGRLSSVVDLNMKEGDSKEYHAEGGIGLIASRLTLEGPIQKGKSSFIISGRRTYADLFLPLFMKDADHKVGYYFYDLNGKVNFSLGAKDHIYVSSYFGSDKFYSYPKSNMKDDPVQDKFDLNWGNITAVARWNHEFGPKLFGNLTAYYSQYKFKIGTDIKVTKDNETTQYIQNVGSSVKDKAIKYDIDFLPNTTHTVKMGVGAIAHTYEPTVQTTKVNSETTPLDSKSGSAKINALEFDAFIEDDIRISSKLKTNVGLHYAVFSVNGQLYHSLQPRISARYLINDDMSFKASYARMNQYVQLLTNSSIGLPTDLWVPVTDRIPPQVAHQVAAGLAYTHRPTGVEFSVEGYYKTMKNVLEYNEGAGFTSNSVGWEDKIVIGNGKSYGAELLVQKKAGRLTGLLSYALSWTNRQFPGLNEGKAFPFRYDRRHDFKIAAVYSLTPKIDISAEWVYGTGSAITLPVGRYQGIDGDDINIYSSRNGYRMPAYHRGDVSIKFMRKRKRFERAWIISVYNVYNRANPFYISQNEKGQFTKASLFPILPSVTYQFKF